MDGIIGSKLRARLLEGKTIRAIEDYGVEFVKIESADCQENENPTIQTNLACLGNFYKDEPNSKKSCDEEKFNLVTIKNEEVQIKSEENWENLDESLQDNTSGENTLKCTSSLSIAKELKERNVDYESLFKNDTKTPRHRCSYKCNSRNLLIKHQLYCNNKRNTCNAELNQCSCCFFDASLDVKITEPEKLKESFYQCPNCPYASWVKDTYLWHLRTHQISAKPGLVYCSECPFSTSYKRSLIRHIERHTVETDFQCKYCSYCSTTASKVTDHEKLHEINREMGEKLHKCHECPYACTTEKTFKRHKACHDANTGIKCQFCTFKTDNPVLYGTHRNLHSLEPFKCTKCSYKTWKAIYLKRHSLKHEPKYIRSLNHSKDENSNHDKPDLVYCKECPFSSRFKACLIVHFESHRRKTGFRCRYCSYHATRTVKIRSHEKLHTPNAEIRVKNSIKNLGCKQCPYTCSSSHVLKKHVACHSSKTGMPCSLCTFKTESVSLYFAHRKLHKLERFKNLKYRFKCDECRYLTYRRNLLINHIKKKHSNR